MVAEGCTDDQSFSYITSYTGYVVLVFIAIWHQYDDAAFSHPSFWESIRSLFPYVHSMDPAEGRYIAMRVMLPDWDTFGVHEANYTKKGSDVLQTINEIIYCMENNKIETGGRDQILQWNNFSLEQVC